MKVSFQFPSLLKLLDFAVTTKVKYFSMNREDFILVAEASEPDIELAEVVFDAEIMSITRTMVPAFNYAQADGLQA